MEHVVGSVDWDVPAVQDTKNLQDYMSIVKDQPISCGTREKQPDLKNLTALTRRLEDSNDMLMDEQQDAIAINAVAVQKLVLVDAVNRSKTVAKEWIEKNGSSATRAFRHTLMLFEENKMHEPARITELNSNTVDKFPLLFGDDTSYGAYASTERQLVERLVEGAQALDSDRSWEDLQGEIEQQMRLISV
ncbi:hypothetical protein B0T25DRAFT_563172 [Lasiosphaeria hispida]|uniref:Uncharacterized protein n=1 Tax=Lasiosphaeria hispida TaxID=260671 RepID=A0AAJ0MKT7_9PEZI|nr:hypothetical protein B0T25DRAFT_563172 [Lasiosphaeria hispida]